MATISPINQQPFPGSPLFQLLAQHIGRQIAIQTSNGEITGELSGVDTGFLTITKDGGEELYVVFATVVSFSFQ